MCRLGLGQEEHESKEGALPVKGAVEWRGLSARRDTNTVHSMVQRVQPWRPTLAAHLEHGLKMASAPSSRMAQKIAGPLKAAHHGLEAGCGWPCSKHGRRIPNLVPRWRQRRESLRGGGEEEEGCFAR